MTFKPIVSLLAAVAVLLLFGQAASAAGGPPADAGAIKPVQVFDVAAGRVVKTMPNDAEFQAFAAAWLQSVTGLAPQVQAGADCPYVYRVPLAKPATVTAGTVKVETADVFLFNCRSKPPLLLVFDAQRRPYLLQFQADIAPFVRKTGIPASGS